MAFGWNGQSKKRRFGLNMCCSTEKVVIHRTERGSKVATATETLEYTEWSLCSKIHKRPWRFDYGQSTLLSSSSNASRRLQSQSTRWSRTSSTTQIPTVGKTALGQAGDITLAMGPGQIYQNVWNSKHKSLVSWCSFNTWTPRLTVDIPGFVVGVATQTLLQNLFAFSERKRLWCELWV